MTTSAQAQITVAEAAFISGVAAKDINREIDARIVPASGAERRLRRGDLVYLLAIKDLKHLMAPALRRNVRKAIANAVVAHEPVARFSTLEFRVADLETQVLDGFAELDRLIGTHIEQVPEILRGEAVIRGTRIAARHLADLHRLGATAVELQHDYELSEDQVRAALAFARTQPQRGRPAAQRRKVTDVSAA